MNNQELLELRRILLESNQSNDWSLIEDAIEFINEFVETDDSGDDL
jgi:hypothetical protein